MTGWGDDLLVLTVGSRARETLRSSPISRLCRAAEELLDENARHEVELILERVALGSVVIDARDVDGDLECNELTRHAVSFLRKRLPIRPLVVLDVPATASGEWSPAWLISLSRGLGAPVVRAAEPSVLPAWQVASLWWESLGPGVTGIDGRDVETAFRRVSGGAVFRWSPWNGDELATVPPPLLGALRGESVASVFVTYRFGSTGTLHRIDTVMCEIENATPQGADMLFASPTVDTPEDEILVTVIHARRRCRMISGQRSTRRVR